MKIPDVTFSGLNVLVVGDIMLDRYYWGTVRRISPEAPVPVVKIEETNETLGGAGNVANNLAGLNCNATVVGVCGEDSAGRALRRLLAIKNIRDHLITDPGRPTITKTRIMAKKQQMMRLDQENTSELDKNTADRIVSVVEQLLDDAQVVILSDYGKGMFATAELTQKIIGLARDRKRPVLVDPKGTDWQRYARATCITPNTLEFEAVAGATLDRDDRLLEEKGRGVRARYDLEWLLITRGAKGMCLVGPDGHTRMIPAKAREVFDVSGAGDTVIATVAAALASGMTFADAARTANLAAGIVVGKLGTQPILASELQAAVQYTEQRRMHPDLSAKIMALDAALERVDEWRRAGQTVVFTNGCFDLLHPGHISLLHQARELGDRLVVGLNTDGSIRRLKGPDRPILAEQDRAAILSALACVDLVVHFDEDTPVELIRSLAPDILVKGADYKPDEVVGKEIVEAYGGCVRLVELVHGYSTTRITRKVLAAGGSEKQNGPGSS